MSRNNTPPESVYCSVEALKIEPTGRFLIPMTLVWAPGDPLAVILLFPGGRQWTTSRELLTEAMNTTTHTVGEGDVRFRPVVHNHALVLLQLRAPKGKASLRLHRADIQLFLLSVADCDSHNCADPTVELDAWLEKTLSTS